jgi:hypothetical protein
VAKVVRPDRPAFRDDPQSTVVRGAAPRIGIGRAAAMAAILSLADVVIARHDAGAVERAP